MKLEMVVESVQPSPDAKKPTQEFIMLRATGGDAHSAQAGIVLTDPELLGQYKVGQQLIVTIEVVKK